MELNLINILLIIGIIAMLVFLAITIVVMKKKYDKEIKESEKRTNIAVGNAKLHYIKNKEELEATKQMFNYYKNNDL